MNFNNQFIVQEMQDSQEFATGNVGVLNSKTNCLSVALTAEDQLIIEGVKLYISDPSADLDIELQSDQILTLVNIGQYAIDLSHNAVADSITAFQFNDNLTYSFLPYSALSFVCKNQTGRKGWYLLK